MKTKLSIKTTAKDLRHDLQRLEAAWIIIQATATRNGKGHKCEDCNDIDKARELYDEARTAIEAELVKAVYHG